MAKQRSELPPVLKALVGPKATQMEVLQAERLYETGVKAGTMMGYGEMLSLLEQKYMSEDAPERGTPEALAILELAKELGNLLREKLEK